MQSRNAGRNDGFIATFSAATGEVLQATYLGGNSSDSATAIAVDAAGRVHVAGGTQEGNLPFGTPAIPIAFANDTFVTSLAPDLSRLGFTTYLGAVNSAPFAIATDPFGGVVIVGDRDSSRCMAPGNWGRRAFTARFLPETSTASYVDCVGPGEYLQASAVAIDRSGIAHIVGNASGDVFLTSRDPRPFISREGMVNGASLWRGDKPASPGSLMTIFGTGLSATTARAASEPWSSILGGTSVSIGGIPLL